MSESSDQAALDLDRKRTRPGGPSPWRGARDTLRRVGTRAFRWLLLLVVLLAAIIGVLFVTRGTAVRHLRGVGDDASPVSPGEPAFPLTVAVLTGTALLSQNRVELALNGTGTFPRLWADLSAARRSITVQLYYAQPGRIADTLASILAERARAGVRVYLLYDAFGANGLSDEYMAGLRDAGVRTVAFRPLRFENLWVIQNRSHVRGIVVDGRIGWTGGFGIDDKWLGDGRRPTEWRETNVRFEGPAVRQLQGAFIAGWAEATGALLSGRMTLEVPAVGETVAGLLHTAPTLGSTPAERFLALSLGGARRSLYVTNAYFAPDSSFVAFLTRAARRGVDVRVLVGGPRTDIRAARLAARSHYEALLTAGVRVYEYQPSTLHAKTFVVDDVWVSVGTMNFDNRSLALNDESTLMVLDSLLGRRMRELFFDDLRFAKQIDLTTFRRRPWTERIMERAAAFLTPLL